MSGRLSQSQMLEELVKHEDIAQAFDVLKSTLASGTMGEIIAQRIEVARILGPHTGRTTANKLVQLAEQQWGKLQMGGM